MKILYTKSNNQRAQKFQTITKILKSEKNQIYTSKTPITNEANEHLNNMYENYFKLKEKYTINMVEPKKSNNELHFEYLPYKSIESLLHEFYEQDDQESIDQLIKKYISFINSFVDKKYTKFIPSEKFISIFGDIDIQEKIDIISLPNIDLIFSNIFVSDKGEFIVIDYEWVFDFDMPKDFIITRALVEFSSKFPLEIQKYIGSFDKYKDIYFSMEENFHNYVFDINKEYIYNQTMQKNIFELSQENRKYKSDLKLLEEDTQNFKKEKLELEKQYHELEKQYHELYDIAQSLRLKNRVKNILKLFLPKA